MEVGTAAIALNGLLDVVSKLTNNPDISTTVGDIQANKKNILNANDSLIKQLDINKLNRLFAVNGNMIALKKDVIVEPLMVISEDAFNSKEYSNIGGLMLDMFTNHYADTFNTLQNVYGLDSQTIISVLGTDNGFSKLKSMAVGRALNMGVDKLATMIHESGNSTSFDELMALNNTETQNGVHVEVVEEHTVESSIPGINLGLTGPKGQVVTKQINMSSNPVEYIKNSKEGILGQTMLERRIIITLRPHNLASSEISPNRLATAAKLDSEIKAIGNKNGISNVQIDGYRIPITIKARLLKVTTENIASVSEPHKKFNTLTTWLDYKSGLSSLYDYLFQTEAIKKYRKNLFKGNDFLKIINERKISAYSKVATTAVVGFELNYTLMMITERDRQLLNRYLSLNIFKEKEKDDFLASVYAITCAVVDDDSEMATFLTPQVRGINSVSYRELKKFSGKSEYDIGDLLMAITKSRMLG